MNPKKADFLGIPLDAITMEETVAHIDQSIQDKVRITHVVVNAWTVVAMQKDKELFQNILSCDLISPDGQSIVWGGRFLGKQIPERVPGPEVMERLVSLAARRGYRCFFFGAKQEVVQKVADVFTEQFGPSIIGGFRNGYYTTEEEPEIARQIGESNSHMLFIAMPSPKKENFMYNHRDALSGILYNLGVGGTFDLIAGVTKRAPRWMQRNGLEWFYRLIQEPRRMWKRYLIGNISFIILVLRARFGVNRKQR